MADVPEKWWVDPTYDPMQDLHDCKYNISLMAPAVKQHAEIINELIRQNSKLTEIVEQDRIEIALLAKRVLDLTHRIEILQMQPISNVLKHNLVK